MIKKIEWEDHTDFLNIIYQHTGHTNIKGRFYKIRMNDNNDKFYWYAGVAFSDTVHYGNRYDCTSLEDGKERCQKHWDELIINCLEDLPPVKEQLYRVRFRANKFDYRPVKWPVKHPYWLVGEGGFGNTSYSIVISYANNKKYIYDNWPEAKKLEKERVEGYKFTDRFPKPEWFKG